MRPNHRWQGIVIAVALLVLGASGPVSAGGAFAPAPQNGDTAADSAGRLHTVTVSEASGQSALLYQILDPFAAGHPAPSVLLRETTSRIRRPQIVVDRRGGVHVLWQERFAKTEGARDAQGTWVHYLRFNNGELAGGLQHHVLNDRPQALHPNLAVDGRGGAVVVWEEDAALVVSRIVPTGLVSARRLAAEPARLDRRAFPAVAVDRQGQIHVAWTDHSPNASDQMVYSVLTARTLEPQIAQQTVQKINGVYAQRKSLALEPSGNVRLTWTDKLAPGRLAERSDPNRIWIASGGGPAGALVRTYGLADRHLHEESVSAAPSAWVAVPSRHPGFSALSSRTVLDSAAPPEPELIPALLSSAIEKRLKREILAFASWSGPPPGSVIDAPSSVTAYASAPRARDLSVHSQYLHRLPSRQSYVALGRFETGALSVWMSLIPRA